MLKELSFFLKTKGIISTSFDINFWCDVLCDESEYRLNYLSIEHVSFTFSFGVISNVLRSLNY